MQPPQLIVEIGMNEFRTKKRIEKERRKKDGDRVLWEKKNSSVRKARLRPFSVHSMQRMSPAANQKPPQYYVWNEWIECTQHISKRRRPNTNGTASKAHTQHNHTFTISHIIHIAKQAWILHTNCAPSYSFDPHWVECTSRRRPQQQRRHHRTFPISHKTRTLHFFFSFICNPQNCVYKPLPQPHTFLRSTHAVKARTANETQVLLCQYSRCWNTLLRVGSVIFREMLSRRGSSYSRRKGHSGTLDFAGCVEA